MILFTDDELDKLTDVEKYNCEAIPMTRDICKEQARKLWEYLNDGCTEHPTPSVGYLYEHRRNCTYCCAEIEKELKQ